MPTGKMLFWGRSPLDRDTQERVNDTPAYVWDPGKSAGAFTAVRPPAIDVDGDGDLEEAPLFCSGQSLLPSGEVLATGGTLTYPVYRRRVDRERLQGARPRVHLRSLDARLDGAAVDAQGPLVPHPGDARGRADRDPRRLGRGRCAPADNPDLEVFTPAAVRGGRGAMTRYAERRAAGHELLPASLHDAGRPTAARRLRARRVGPARPVEAVDAARAFGLERSPRPVGATTGSRRARCCSPPGRPARRRWRSSAGSARTSPDTVDARADADVIDTRDANPRGGATTRSCPRWTAARDYFNVVLLPDGSLASVGGAAGVRNTGSPPARRTATRAVRRSSSASSCCVPAPTAGGSGRRSASGARTTRARCCSRTAACCSAGDDYWDLDDTPDPYIRQGPTAGKPLDEAELYEPPYLFDGNARAPRPASPAARRPSPGATTSACRSPRPPVARPVAPCSSHRAR